jgi:hypothetical protein
MMIELDPRIATIVSTGNRSKASSQKKKSAERRRFKTADFG